MGLQGSHSVMAGLVPATHAPSVVLPRHVWWTGHRAGGRVKPGHDGEVGVAGGPYQNPPRRRERTPAACTKPGHATECARYPSTTFFSTPFSTGGYRRNSQIIRPIEGQAANVQIM